MDKKALSKLSYGMYVASCSYEGKVNAFIANSVFQVSSSEPKIAISINKEVYSNQLITQSGKFGLSVLNKDTPIEFIKTLGFFSGKSTDKTIGLVQKDVGGVPVFLDHACAYMTVIVENTVDCGTHTLFIGTVEEAELIDNQTPMTYQTYQEHKGATPRQAPTFNVPKIAPRGPE